MDYQEMNMNNAQDMNNAETAQPEAPKTAPEAAEAAPKKGNIFSKLFRTRLKVVKDNVTILNVSMLFLIISALCAFWLVLIGAAAALLLGYRFAVEKDSPDFCGDLQQIVSEAKTNAKNAVKSFQA